MIFVLLTILIVLIIFGPQLWVRYVLKKHHRTLNKMPGTGGELARHLLDRFNLEHVKLETCDFGQDHYDPQTNTVRLSPAYFEGKTLTSVAVAAHEVGHAIQFNRNEPVSWLRKRYLGKAQTLQKAGVYLLMFLPLIAAITRVPHFTAIMAIAGLLTLFSSVFVYLAILPEEWDASFNKALPILSSGDYVPAVYLKDIRQILKACALTYVAAALASVLSLWRWFAILRYLR